MVNSYIHNDCYTIWHGSEGVLRYMYWPDEGKIERLDKLGHVDESNHWIEFEPVDSLGLELQDFQHAIRANDRVFIVGGVYWSGQHHVYTNVDVYNPANGTLVPGPGLLQGRSSQGLERLGNGNLITFGGFWADGIGTTGDLGTSEIFDLSQQLWTGGPRLNHARRDSASLQINGVVYVFGGYSGGVPLQSAEKYGGLDAGLVAYYPFDSNANDLSGNGNHGTVNGAVLTSDRLGNANSAYHFNTSGYIAVSEMSRSTRYFPLFLSP